MGGLVSAGRSSWGVGMLYFAESHRMRGIPVIRLRSLPSTSVNSCPVMNERSFTMTACTTTVVETEHRVDNFGEQT